MFGVRVLEPAFTGGSRTPRTKRRQAAALHITALLLLTLSLSAHAQGPLLIQEVISREVGLFNGQGPDNQVVSREVSIYVEWGRDNQVISREYSLCMTDAAPPPVVSNTVIVATASPSGHTVALDWSAYNQWAVRDVSYYNVYYSLTPFTSVTGMMPYAVIPGETLSATFTGLTEWVDHYFAVVPVDALGNYQPAVLYKGVYVLFPQMISREVGVFVGQGPDNQVISREYSLNYVDTNAPPRINNTDITMTVSPKGDTVTVDWSAYNQWAVRDVSHYAIYYSSAPIYSATGTPYRIVPGESFSTTFTGLTEWVDHYFAVIPVDGLGNFNPNVLYRAAYVLFPQMISREVGLFVGQGPDQQVISREVSFVRADTNVPAAVSYLGSPFDATASKTKYRGIDLNWSFYNEWAQRDVVRYRLYVSTGFFNDVSAMTPWAYSANGMQFDTVTNLACELIYYTAVVAEDAGGNFTTAVYSISSKASVCALGEVSNLVGQAFVSTIAYTWDLGGIGTDLGFFVDHFRVYFGGSTSPISVASTGRSWTATGLTPGQTYTVRVATVDIFGFESAGMSLAMPAGNAPLRWDVDAGTPGPQDGSGTWDGSVSNWWVAEVNARWNSTRPDSAIFGSTGTAGAVTLAGTQSIWNLTFEPVASGSYTISGSTLRLVESPTVTVHHDAAIHSALAGSGFTVTGDKTLTLGSANSFTGLLRVAGGVVRAGNGAALGSSSVGTVVTNGGTLDVNGQNLGGEVVTISGSGANGRGAIVNEGAAQWNALQYVRLAGDATVGATSAWDVRAGTSPYLDLAGHTLTKIGPGQITIANAQATNAGNIVVRDGVLGLHLNSALTGPGTVTVFTGGVFSIGNFGGSPVMAKPMVMSGGVVRVDFGSGGATFGSTIQLEAGVTNGVETPDAPLFITNAVTGPGGFHKTGTNTVHLLGNNSFAGDIVVHSGAVRIAHASALGLSSNIVLVPHANANVAQVSRVELANAAHVGDGVRLVMGTDTNGSKRSSLYGVVGSNDWNGRIELTGDEWANIAMTGSATRLHLRGPITGPAFKGTLILQGGSAQTGMVFSSIIAPSATVMKAGSSVWSLHAASNEWATLGLFAGTLRLAAPDILPPGARLSMGAGAGNMALLDLGGYTQRVGQLLLESTGGAKTIGNGSGISDATLVVAGPGVSTYGAPIIDSVLGGTRKTALVVDGGHTLTLSGTNTYTGGTMVRSGVLQSARIGTTTISAIPPGAPVTVLTGATLRLVAADALGVHAGNPSLVTIDGGVQTITSGVHASLGSYVLNGGTITSEGAGSATGNYIFDGRIETRSNGAASVISAQRVFLRATNGPVVTFDVERGTGSVDLVVSAVLTGSAGLVKSGQGIMSLLSSNTYPGATTVSNGTLLVGGTLHTGVVTVGSAATLGGAGLIRGAVQSSGVIAPGNPVGRLIMGRTYTQGAGASLSIEIGGPVQGTQYDCLVVSNAANLAGSLNVAFADGYQPEFNLTFVLVTAGSRIGVFDVVSLPPLSNGLAWSLGYSSTSVTLSAVYPNGIVITNPPTDIAVSNEVDTYTVQGTAGPDVTSSIRWTNLLTGGSGSLVPASRWSIADVALGVGSNEIRVSGFAGQDIASDHASNSVYSSGWPNGANGGFGWSGGWVLESAPQGGHFRGTSGSNPNMSTGPFGWGMWANSGGWSAAIRSFPPLTPTHGFICLFDNNSVQVGGSVGLSFQNSEGTNLFEMYAIGGQSTYFINDSLGSRSSGISTSSAGWAIYFQPSGTDGYLFQMNGIAMTGALMSATNQQVSRVRAFNSNSGSGQAADFFINDIRVIDFEAYATTGVVVIARVSPAGGDSDNDGLPDWWEIQYGLNPNVSNAVSSDSDWMTDFEEYIADTDPTNSASFFPPVLLTNQAGSLPTIVVNPTSTGRVYQVIWATNLVAAPQAWTLIPPEQTGTRAAVLFPVTNAGYYRTGVRLP